MQYSICALDFELTTGYGHVNQMLNLTTQLLFGANAMQAESLAAPDLQRMKMQLQGAHL